MNRRLFITALVLSISGLSGCITTSALFSEVEKKEYKEYSESVSRILSTPDGKKIVVIGKDYHYIFDVSSKLIALMNSPLHPYLSAEMKGFDVSLDSKVRGTFILYLAEGASEDNKKLAESFGFTPEKPSPYLQFWISGMRYSAGKINVPPAQAVELNREYQVDVTEERPIGGKAVLLLATPLTVAADGVLLLLAIPLVPVVLPFIAAAGPIGWGGAGR